MLDEMSVESIQAPFENLHSSIGVGDLKLLQGGNRHLPQKFSQPHARFSTLAKLDKRNDGDRPRLETQKLVINYIAITGFETKITVLV